MADIHTLLTAQDVDYSMGEGFERQRAEAAALLQALDRKKAARTMAVPTDDKQVKARLREMGEPVTLFGEGVSHTCIAVSVDLIAMCRPHSQETDVIV